MYSFLGELFSLLLRCLFWIPRRVVEELGLSLDGFRLFLGVWLDEALDPPQQAIASMQSSVGPPTDWLTLVRSLLRPARLARVRVPTRRSTR